jgi:carbamoyltransferase
MKIIGMSGVENAMAFKRSEWPGREEREYRMVQGQDAAACLLVDGEIVAAAEEERFDRRKHSDRFPSQAIRYCLDQGGLAIEDVDGFAHAFDYTPFKLFHSLSAVAKRRYREVYSREAILGLLERDFPELRDPAGRFHNVEHHLAHAASAYYTTGWDECLLIVIDGMGEMHAVSAWTGRDGKIDNVRRITANQSIGILYSLVTLHLGFDFNSDEYKIMGLAPYGDPERYRAFFDQVVEFRDDGSIEIPLLGVNKTPTESEFYEGTRAHLSEHLIPARDPDDDISDDHRDVAASLQACLNRTIHHICTHFARETGQRRLAMAGGVALNCTANGQLLKSGFFDEIYVQPAAGDDGAALGAALHLAAKSGSPSNRRMAVPYLGPAYDADRVETALERFAGRISVVRFDSLEETCKAAATSIAGGSVIGWHRGRMEFGPRALGNRSILADPGNPEMRDRVNAMVKMREAFRPFAPAVSQEQAHLWFDLEEGTELPYMIFIVDVREEHREELPAITHVDGTARVQTVSARSNPAFHALLGEVGALTGREMVLNTSFNVKGQPIVNTPEESIETFLGTGIDLLFLENVLVKRG